MVLEAVWIPICWMVSTAINTLHIEVRLQVQAMQTTCQIWVCGLTLLVTVAETAISQRNTGIYRHLAEALKITAGGRCQSTTQVITYTYVQSGPALGEGGKNYGTHQTAT